MKIEIIPKRTEEFLIDLEIDEPKITKTQKKKIDKIFGTYLAKDDSLHITYQFNIEYFGTTVEAFKLMLSLLDKARTKRVNTKEIQHGKSLVQELLCRFEQLEKKYGEKR